jgi:hypothetical protein
MKPPAIARRQGANCESQVPLRRSGRRRCQSVRGTATTATRRRLVDALLAEVLAPVDVAEMEVAE